MTMVHPYGDPQTRMQTLHGYRPDIDGLRAVAVVAVVLFHLRISVVPGGYVGVDVFFVISGYLITAMLLERHENLMAMVGQFYERRVRRIIPALLALLTATAAAAWIELSPEEFLSFSGNLVAALLFVSNIYSEHATNYFTLNAQWQPLLHLWSLAIEEQFYLVYPVLIFFLSKKKSVQLRWSLLAVAAVSFGICIAKMGHPSAFYSAITRAWELLLGAEALLFGQGARLTARNAELLAGVGFLMIIAAILFLQETDNFPGYYAALPTVGAALVIYADTHEMTAISRLLGNAPIVRMGLISYSLYLWHWPIIVFYKRYVLRELAWEDLAVILALTFLLAYLSWRFVERPFRRRRGHRSPRYFLGAAAGGALLFAFGVLGITESGFPARFTPQTNKIFAYGGFMKSPEHIVMYNWNCWQIDQDLRRLKCVHWVTGKHNVLLWGDSYAGRYQFGLSQVISGTDIALSSAFMSACWPVLDDRRHVFPLECDKFNALVYRTLKGRSASIVLGARLSAHPNDIEELANTAILLAKEGHSVTILSARPDLTAPAPWLIARFNSTGDRRFLNETPFIKPDEKLAEQALIRMLRNRRGITFIAGTDVCGQTGCPIALPHDIPITWDVGHFTAAGSLLAAERIWPKLSKSLHNP